MGMRTVCAAIVCKATYHLLRLMGRGGTSLPGKIALKIDPSYLATMSKGVRTIVITGTNGKTTSTHIVAQALENMGEQAFYNRSGANLIQGITTEFAIRSSLTGKPRYKLAAIECDEGALRRVCRQLDPAVLVVTNIFRDQLDRYGEVTHTLENIMGGVENSPNATLVLNADDSMAASISRRVGNKAIFYGVNCEIYPRRVDDLSDATHCIECGAPYEYDYVTFAHLGGFRCPACGYARPQPQVAVERILERHSNSCVLEMSVDGEASVVPVDVPASYDIYNCACVVAGLIAFGFSKDQAFDALAKFKHGFGRSEVLDVNGTPVRLMLMKNPAGCNQIINLLLNEPDEGMGLACILNDQECDGTDVSWIYDASWEALCTPQYASTSRRPERSDPQASSTRHPERSDPQASSTRHPERSAAQQREVEGSFNQRGPRITSAICAGDRAEDMALRLKYAGMPQDGIRIMHDYGALIDELGRTGLPVTVVANYSAMLEFRAEAARVLGLAGFWEG